MNILIIEKSKTVSHILKSTLIPYGYNITEDSELFASEYLIPKNIFEVIILDTNIEGNNTTKEILKKIKDCKDTSTKILGICTLGSWKDKVSFLNNGGDDVLSYPFPMQELIARVQSLVRRPNTYIDSKIYVGSLTLDTQSRIATYQEEDIDLRKKEFELLEYLARNSNRTVSRCELLDHVWDYRSYTGSNTVDVHIKRIRDKLPGNIIETIHGHGYKVKDPKSSLASQGVQNQDRPQL